MISITPQAAIYLVKVPFNGTQADTLYFSTKAAQNTYFEGLQKQTFTDYSYVKKDNAIKIELNYELAKNYNYLYYDNITQTNTGLTNKRIFAFITGMSYVNENTTKIFIKTDVIQTYLMEILSDTTSVSYINQQHVKKSDDIIGKYLLDEGIQGSEYVKSQLLDETDYDNDTSSIQWPSDMTADAKLTWFNNSLNGYMVIVGCSQSIIPGTENLLKNRNYGGIYSGLYYYAFGNVDQLSVFIEYLNQSALIGAVYNMFMLPVSISTWTPKNSNISYLTYDEEGNSTESIVNLRWFYLSSTTYRSLDTLHCTTPTNFRYAGSTLLSNGYTPHNNKLYTYPYCCIQLSNNNGGIANYMYEYFDNKDDCQIKVNGTVSQGGSIIAYPLNYKGRSSNWDEPLDMAKFPTCSWNTDSYTNWLTQNGVSRSNRYLYAEKNKEVKKFNNTWKAIKGGAKLVAGVGSAVVAGPAGLAAGIPLAASGLKDLIGASQTNETDIRLDKEVRALEEEQYRASLVPDTVNNGTATPEVLFSMKTFEFTAWALTITGERAKQIDAYFDRFGYTVNEYKNIVQAITNRSKWNYIKTADCKIEADIPDVELEEILNIFNNGITFWKNPSEIYRYDLGGSNV